MKKWMLIVCAMSVYLVSFSVMAAASIEIPMYEVSQIGFGKKIGTVTMKDSKYGLIIIPHLAGLSPAPGTRGFHVHETPNCDNFGMAAQGHFDPEKKNKHLGPYDDNGTLGDLPPLVIDSNGTATLPLLAPRLTVKLVQGHSLVIHIGSDNFSDTPDINGGGGDRYACGVIPITPGAQVGNSKTTPSGVDYFPPDNSSTNKYGIDVEGSEVAPVKVPSTSTVPPSTTTTKKTTPSNNNTISIPAGSTDSTSTLTPEQTQELLDRKKELQKMQEDNMKQIEQLNKTGSSLKPSRVIG